MAEIKTGQAPEKAWPVFDLAGLIGSGLKPRRFAVLGPQSLQDVARRHGQVVHSDSRGSGDGVGDGGHGRHDRHFADASDSVRVAWVSHLHDDGIDHRQVQAGWHSVVQEGGVLHPAIGVVEVFFIQSPADSLHHATLHLSFDIAGVDGFAGVLHDGVVQDRDLAGLRVHFDIDNDGIDNWNDVGPNGEDYSRDHDNDGLDDGVDPDDDNDGILDVDEIDGVVGVWRYDHDNDGLSDRTDTDDDNDGLSDWFEQNDGWDLTGQFDHDNDGIDDYLDDDDDGDGIPDDEEDDGIL